MCDPSHIQLAAAGTRLSRQFRSTRIEREAKNLEAKTLETKANAFKDVAFTEQTLRPKLAIEPADSRPDSWR